MATIEDLKSWIERDITRFSPSEDHVFQFDSGGSVGEEGSSTNIKFRIFTDNNSYNISATERSNDNGYLGCIASSRKPRAGENWTRGNDLKDGDLCAETWHEILGDILSYEMVKIHKPVKPTTIEEVSIDAPLISE